MSYLNCFLRNSTGFILRCYWLDLWHNRVNPIIAKGTEMPLLPYTNQHVPVTQSTNKIIILLVRSRIIILLVRVKAGLLAAMQEYYFKLQFICLKISQYSIAVMRKNPFPLLKPSSLIASVELMPTTCSWLSRGQSVGRRTVGSKCV